MKIFRFQGIDKFERDFAFIKENKIWASKLESLNDPNEALIDLKKFSESLNLTLKIIKPFEKNNQKLINEFTEAIHESIKLNRKYGFYCLSKSLNNELMWAHYASGHKGYCLEYNAEELKIFPPNNIFSKSYSSLVKINYSKKIKHLSVGKSTNINSIAKEVLSNKSNAWKYEQEMRVITKMTGEHIYNKDSLKAVHFGLRSSEEIINKMTNELNVKFYKIKREENSYKLISERIK